LLFNLSQLGKNMKKLMLGAAVSAVLLSGVANATVKLDSAGKPVITPADTYEVYLSGASAAQSFIDLLLTSTKVPSANRLCDSTKTIYKYGDNGSGKDQNAYLCVLNPANPALTGLAAGKANLLIYKRSVGGSAMGVSPLIAEANGNAADTSIDYLKVDNADNCSVPVISGGLSKITCTYAAGDATKSQSHASDFGISDVDPKQFRGDNTEAGFNPVTAADVTKLTVKSAAVNIFNVPVTLKLRNALQEAQFPLTSACNPRNAKYKTGFAGTAESANCMPSLSSGVISSIFSGKISSWSQLRFGTGGNLTNNAASTLSTVANDRVHICRRVSGSGTQAQLGIKFLNYPCNDTSTAAKADTGALPEAAPSAQVHALSSSGGVTECLNELDAGTNTVGTSFNNTYGDRWAIGIQAADLNANLANNFRFIKVDGNAPTLQNVVNGKYKDWVELTFQYNTDHVFDPSEKEIVEEIIKQSANPVVMAGLNLNAVHSFGQAGFLAVPQSFTPNVDGKVDLTKPVNPLSHGTQSDKTDNCRMPAAYNLGVTNGLQLVK
jgi:hypothetical protein